MIRPCRAATPRFVRGAHHRGAACTADHVGGDDPSGDRRLPSTRTRRAQGPGRGERRASDHRGRLRPPVCGRRAVRARRGLRGADRPDHIALPRVLRSRVLPRARGIRDRGSRAQCAARSVRAPATTVGRRAAGHPREEPRIRSTSSGRRRKTSTSRCASTAARRRDNSRTDWCGARLLLTARRQHTRRLPSPLGLGRGRQVHRVGKSLARYRARSTHTGCPSRALVRLSRLTEGVPAAWAARDTSPARRGNALDRSAGTSDRCYKKRWFSAAGRRRAGLPTTALRVTIGGVCVTRTVTEKTD